MVGSKSYKIILADDDPDDRELFREAFDGLDADVETVHNGVQLMSELRSGKRPDFIFLDLNMPELNGKECLKEIREMDLPHIRVAIYSTSSNSKDIDDTFELGADLYVKKPNTFTELIRIAENILAIDWDDRNVPQFGEYVFKC